MYPFQATEQGINVLSFASGALYQNNSFLTEFNNNQNLLNKINQSSTYKKPFY